MYHILLHPINSVKNCDEQTLPHRMKRKPNYKLLIFCLVKWKRINWDDHIIL